MRVRREFEKKQERSECHLPEHFEKGHIYHLKNGGENEFGINKSPRIFFDGKLYHAQTGVCANMLIGMSTVTSRYIDVTDLYELVQVGEE